MSTDPTFTVEWTVPADEWGDDAHDDRTGDPTARENAHPTPSDAREESRPDAKSDRTHANRDPENLPSAPVLAAHVDALRAECDARESEADAIRERYETIIDERNAEIRELRSRSAGWRTFVGWVRNLI